MQAVNLLVLIIAVGCVARQRTPSSVVEQAIADLQGRRDYADRRRDASLLLAKNRELLRVGDGQYWNGVLLSMVGDFVGARDALSACLNSMSGSSDVREQAVVLRAFLDWELGGSKEALSRVVLAERGAIRRRPELRSLFATHFSDIIRQELIGKKFPYWENRLEPHVGTTAYNIPSQAGVTLVVVLVSWTRPCWDAVAFLAQHLQNERRVTIVALTPLTGRAWDEAASNQTSFDKADVPIKYAGKEEELLALRAVLEREGAKFPVVVCSKQYLDETLGAGWPMVYVIGGDGRVRGATQGSTPHTQADLRSLVEKALKE